MNAKERVSQFFKTELEQYIIGDLLRLSEIRPDIKTGLRGCTVPQAMVNFAILDLLGYLINEDLEASKKDTLKNYRVIFSSKYGLFPEQYEKEVERIVKLFRHGIVHQFFPKASAVGKLSKDSPLIGLSGNVPCLNVDRLSEDVLNAIIELARRIESGECNDLAERMNCHLDILAKEDFAELNRLQFCQHSN
jgi:hypothetical protein